MMAESELGYSLATLGGLLLLGLLADFIGRKTIFPRVTLLVIFGLIIGPSLLDVIPHFTLQWVEFVTDLGLLMVGFLLGEKLAYSWVHKNSREVLWISIGEVLGTASIVFLVLLLLGAPLTLAILLAAIAPASDPVATSDVIHQTNAEGEFPRLLLGVVAIDDAWGLILFSIFLAVAQSTGGHSWEWSLLLSGVWDIVGAMLLGIVLGLPMAYLSGRILPGEPTLEEALGMIFLCGGLAFWLDVSFILAAMFMGLVVAVRAKHHKRPFHAIEGIEYPFLVILFVLAGASLDLDALSQVGVIGLAYIALRMAGQFLGSWFGALIGGYRGVHGRWLGFALMPQAGITLGMALIASQLFPEHKNSILSIVVAGIIFFEVVGPIMTKIALGKNL